MHFWLYVTVTVNVGPARVGGVKTPAHTPIVTGVAVALFAASAVGRPRGLSNVNPFPVEGQVPRVRVLVTAGVLPGDVPIVTLKGKTFSRTGLPQSLQRRPMRRVILSRSGALRHV